jgi:hypothetical protein
MARLRQKEEEEKKKDLKIKIRGTSKVSFHVRPETVKHQTAGERYKLVDIVDDVQERVRLHVEEQNSNNRTLA